MIKLKLKIIRTKYTSTPIIVSRALSLEKTKFVKKLDVKYLGIIIKSDNVYSFAFYRITEGKVMYNYLDYFIVFNCIAN